MENVLLFFSAASALCAVSAVPQRNYHFIYEAKNWTEAQSYCRENYIDLATVGDVKDMALLNNMVDLNQTFASSNNYGAWIGLYNDLNSWRWSWSDPDFYQQNEKFTDWCPSQPDDYYAKESCVAMFVTNYGGWNDIYCFLNYKAVCMNVTGMNATFYVTSATMNWTQAQSYCRANYTDLASVRSLADKQTLLQLVPVGAWIGLYRNTWTWSDGSHFSFTYWNTRPLGGNRSCVAANFGSSGGWEDWTCDLKKVFICYSGPAQRVVKLKLVSDSSLNMSDPAVLQDLLSQLKLKLKDQGVNIVQLRWREQPDGQVFHKDEDEKDTF